MITTTLNNIRACSPCREGWTKLLAGLGKTQADDKPLAYATILEINGRADALWCMRVEPQHWRVWAEFVLWCACEVKHFMKDPRSLYALEITRAYLDGRVTRGELQAARRDADAAATAAAYAAAAYAAAAAAAAADAAAAAADAATAAAATAADAAVSAADAAVSAADVAVYAATTAAYAAAAAAAAATTTAAAAAAYAAAAETKTKQSAKFLELVTQETGV